LTSPLSFHFFSRLKYKESIFITLASNPSPHKKKNRKNKKKFSYPRIKRDRRLLRDEMTTQVLAFLSISLTLGTKELIEFSTYYYHHLPDFHMVQFWHD